MARTSFIADIDELLEDEAYTWAFDTLSGIRATVQKSGHVTQAQHDAVTSIRNARARQVREQSMPTARLADGFSRRRYEGK